MIGPAVSALIALHHCGAAGDVNDALEAAHYQYVSSRIVPNGEVQTYRLNGRTLLVKVGSMESCIVGDSREPRPARRRSH